MNVLNMIKERIHHRQENVLTLDEIKELDKVCYVSTPDVKEEFYYLNGEVGTVIQIKRFPKVIGQRILNCFKGYKDIIITVDMEHMSNRQMTEFLDEKIDKMSNEGAAETKTKYIRRVRNKIADEDAFVQHISQSFDNGKCITMRIFVKGKDLEELQLKVDWICDVLKDREMFGVVQRNILDNDMRSLTCFDNPLKEIITTRGVVNLLMNDNVMEVMDNMMPLGETEAGLPYCPDFMNYKYRSYCISIIGLQGTGKSTLIKSIVQGALQRGEQVIMLDVHNHEYAPLARRYYVPSVTLDMRNSLNPYQIFNNDENTDKISEICIADTVMLNRKMFINMTNEQNVTIVSMYVNVLTEMYQSYIGYSVDEIDNKQWFCASDVKKRILKKYENGEYGDAPEGHVFTLLEHVDMLIKTYGYFFNAKTSINVDITKSIRFDLSFLNVEGGGDLENAFYGLLFSFLGKILRKNEQLNEQLEHGKKVFRPAHPITVVAEETGTILKNIETAKMFDVFMRQTRKSRVSFIYAIHTMNDVIGGTSDYEKLIKSIFGLCASYIIGQIDKKSAEELPNYIKVITPTDAQAAVNFTVRENDKEKRRKFLAVTVDDKKRIVFYSKILPRQRELFGGGK